MLEPLDAAPSKLRSGRIAGNYVLVAGGGASVLIQRRAVRNGMVARVIRASGILGN